MAPGATQALQPERRALASHRRAAVAIHAFSAGSAGAKNALQWALFLGALELCGRGWRRVPSRCHDTKGVTTLKV